MAYKLQISLSLFSALFALQKSSWQLRSNTLHNIIKTSCKLHSLCVEPRHILLCLFGCLANSRRSWGPITLWTCTQSSCSFKIIASFMFQFCIFHWSFTIPHTTHAAILCQYIILTFRLLITHLNFEGFFIMDNISMGTASTIITGRMNWIHWSASVRNAWLTIMSFGRGLCNCAIGCNGDNVSLRACEEQNISEMTYINSVLERKNKRSEIKGIYVNVRWTGNKIELRLKLKLKSL